MKKLLSLSAAAIILFSTVGITLVSSAKSSAVATVTVDEKSEEVAQDKLVSHINSILMSSHKLVDVNLNGKTFKLDNQFLMSKNISYITFFVHNGTLDFQNKSRGFYIDGIHNDLFLYDITVKNCTPNSKQAYFDKGGAIFVYGSDCQILGRDYESQA